MLMNYREQSFTSKFNSAAECLDVKPEQIVSLKFRENVNSYEEYRHLLDSLCQEAGVQCTKLDGDLQGRGYLLGFDKTKVILVEHETGLEILYIAGSIASLIGIIPLILQGWGAMRGRFRGRGAVIDHSVEIRRMDQAGHLHEEHLHDWQPMGSLMSIGTFLPVITTSTNLIENEMKHVVQQLELLTLRIEVLEKQIRRRKKPVVQKISKAKSKRSRSQSQG
jgi:hypothetical protein